METEPENHCLYCHNGIHDKASICTHCGKSQNRFLNNLTFISGMVGLVSLTASAIVFLAGTIDAHHVRTKGADIQILNFSTLKQTTILNNSTQNVVLNKLKVNLENGAQWEVILDQGLEAGEVGRYGTGTLFARQSIGNWAVNFYPGSALGLTLIDPSDGGEIQRLQTLVYENDYTENTIEFINRDGSDFELYQNANDTEKPVEIGCEAELVYTVVRGDIFNQAIDCVGLLRGNAYEKGWAETRLELQAALAKSSEELSLSDFVTRFISHLRKQNSN